MVEPEHTGAGGNGYATEDSGARIGDGSPVVLSNIFCKTQQFVIL
jgi:hypothetical protein